MKRFYKTVAVSEVEGGFSVTLDGRAVRTPGKSPLVMPGRALAEAVAAEWNAQGEKIQPEKMPLTRYTNTVVDRVAARADEVAAEVAAFGASDLLYYRAETPVELIAKQAEGWGPVVAWANAAFGTDLRIGSGIQFVSQAEEDLLALTAAVAEFDPWSLAALHTLVNISGSLLIGLAVAHGHVDWARGFALSRIDEDWQADQWGVDDEAKFAALQRREAFESAHKFLELLRVR